MREMMRVVSYEEARILCAEHDKTTGTNTIYDQVVEVINRTKEGALIHCRLSSGVKCAYHYFELTPIGVNLEEIYER